MYAVKSNAYFKIKKAYFESKLTENIGEPKGLWKSFKFLGLKFERSISDINCLENDFDVRGIVNNFSFQIWPKISCEQTSQSFK